MKFKTIMGLVMGSIASVIVFFGTVLGKGAWTEMRDMKRKAKEQKPAEESKTEETKSEEKPEEKE